MSSSNVVEFRNVCYRYPNGKWSNDNISFTIKKGELVCLLGPNGAGKTTLIKQLCGDFCPTSGGIEISLRGGRGKPFEFKRRLGIVPQEAGLFESLTVYQHLFYFSKIKLEKGSSRDEVDAISKKCGIEPLLNNSIASLSGGQKRLVLFALSLINDPDILILDEPSVGLDPIARDRLWGLVKDLKRDGKAIFLTTHYLHEAEELADTIVMLKDGQVIRKGDVGELAGNGGKSIRLEIIDSVTGRKKSELIFNSISDALQYVKDYAIPAYYLNKMSLEEVYVRMFGAKDRARK